MLQLCHQGAIHPTAHFSGSFVSNNRDMAGGHIEAERLQQSAKDPEKHKDCNEEEEVEKSYKENTAGNAQAAVENLMSNMEFLQRESDLIYVIPKGGQACMQCREPLGLELPRHVAIQLHSSIIQFFCQFTSADTDAPVSMPSAARACRCRPCKRHECSGEVLCEP